MEKISYQIMKYAALFIVAVESIKVYEAYHVDSFIFTISLVILFCSVMIFALLHWNKDE